MTLIISGPAGTGKSVIARELVEGKPNAIMYDEIPPTRPPDFPNTTRTLVIMCTNTEMPLWVHDYPFMILYSRIYP